MSDIELKKCPFCGQHARIFISDGSFPRFIVRCGNSVCPKQSTVEANSLEGAIALWNSRPIEDSLRAENKRLKKELDDLKKEDLLRADTKKVIDYALKEGIIEFPSLELKED